MATAIVMAGNILADRYGATITSKISEVIDSADREIDDVQRSVIDWNKKILD